MFKHCLFFFFLIYILFLAVLGLRFCARAFSSCGKRGPLFIAVLGPLHYCGLSCCGAQAPDAQAQELWLTGLLAPRHVGSSQTRARTRVPCISRQILNHCATREALQHCPFMTVLPRPFPLGPLQPTHHSLRFQLGCSENCVGPGWGVELGK